MYFIFITPFCEGLLLFLPSYRSTLLSLHEKNQSQEMIIKKYIYIKICKYKLWRSWIIQWQGCRSHTNTATKELITQCEITRSVDSSFSFLLGHCDFKLNELTSASLKRDFQTIDCKQTKLTIRVTSIKIIIYVRSKIEKKKKCFSNETYDYLYCGVHVNMTTKELR